MKNNDLHITLSALHDVDVQTPEHQAVLRRALSQHKAPQQTFMSKLRAATKNLQGVPMTRQKLFAGFSSAALIAVMAVGITTFNYGHSPRAQADALVNQSLGFVRTFDSARLGDVQTQLGGDPVKALEEAKAAKDLTILTSDEFKAESAKHRGVATSTLGDGPQSGMVSMSASAAGSTPPPEGAQMHSFSSSAVAVDGSGGPVTSASGPRVVEGEQLPPPAFPSASKYLRYTDGTGRVVVLGLDAQGVPVTRTVYMSDADLR